MDWALRREDISASMTRGGWDMARVCIGPAKEV